MIISRKYKYLFLETPRTGSSAVAKELCLNYDGEKINRKHAHYFHFLKTADPSEREFTVFAGVRNPMDSVVSKYQKYVSNHKERYTDPKWFVKNGGWVTPRDVEIYKFVQEPGHDYGDFLRRFYRTPFINNLVVHSKHCEHILRFEDLNNDFTKMLQRLNVDSKRDLPPENVTSKEKKKSFWEYYPPELQKFAVNCFGPFMLEWGYSFPEDWKYRKPSLWARFIYTLKKMAARVYARLQALTGKERKQFETRPG